jgi:hypothetical protein
MEYRDGSAAATKGEIGIADECARTAPVDSWKFVLPLPAPAFRKNHLLELHFGQRSIFRGIKFVSTDSQEISGRLDKRAQAAINQLSKCRDLQIPAE